MTREGHARGPEEGGVFECRVWRTWLVVWSPRCCACLHSDPRATCATRHVHGQEGADCRLRAQEGDGGRTCRWGARVDFEKSPSSGRTDRVGCVVRLRFGRLRGFRRRSRESVGGGANVRASQRRAQGRDGPCRRCGELDVCRSAERGGGARGAAQGSQEGAEACRGRTIGRRRSGAGADPRARGHAVFYGGKYRRTTQPPIIQPTNNWSVHSRGTGFSTN